jgi:hypothetical protein
MPVDPAHGGLECGVRPIEREVAAQLVRLEPSGGLLELPQQVVGRIVL